MVWAPPLTKNLGNAYASGIDKTNRNRLILPLSRETPEKPKVIQPKVK